MIGPYEDSSTFVALNGPGEALVSLSGVAIIRIAIIFVGGWLSNPWIGCAAPYSDR